MKFKAGDKICSKDDKREVAFITEVKDNLFYIVSYPNCGNTLVCLRSYYVELVYELSKIKKYQHPLTKIFQ